MLPKVVTQNCGSRAPLGCRGEQTPGQKNHPGSVSQDLAGVQALYSESWGFLKVVWNKTMVNTLKWEVFRKLLKDLLQQETMPENVRFDGLILAMKAHGLPCPPERVQTIRKVWLECVEKRKRTHKSR